MVRQKTCIYYHENVLEIFSEQLYRNLANLAFLNHKVGQTNVTSICIQFVKDFRDLRYTCKVWICYYRNICDRPM